MKPPKRFPAWYLMLIVYIGLAGSVLAVVADTIGHAAWWAWAWHVPLTLLLALAVAWGHHHRRRRYYQGKGPRYAWVVATIASPQGKEVGVEIGCDGSPNCAGALHIRNRIVRTGTGREAPTWFEAHLTTDEIRTIMTLLAEALDYYENGRA